MTAPVIPNDLVYPVRGEDRTVFANKANTFNQRLVDEVVPQLNALGMWTNDQAALTSADVTAAQTSATNAANSAAAALSSETNSASNAATVASQIQTVLDSQAQANAILGAGVGTTYLQDGDLYITYVEATVNNVTINPDGLLVIETV